MNTVSVSMKSTKVAMYSEIERLRTLVDLLQQQAVAPVTTPVVAAAPVTPQPQSPGRADFAARCAAYCAEHNVRTVPGDVAKAWLAPTPLAPTALQAKIAGAVIAASRAAMTRKQIIAAKCAAFCKRYSVSSVSARIVAEWNARIPAAIR